MEALANNSIVDISAQHLAEASQKVEDLEALEKEKQKTLHELMDLNSQLYGQIKEESMQFSKGLPIAMIIDDTNAEMVATLQDKINRHPVQADLNLVPLLLSPGETYERDEFTMKTYGEVETKKTELEETANALKKNMIQVMTRIKAEKEDITQYIADNGRETDAIQKATKLCQQDKKVTPPKSIESRKKNLTFDELIQCIADF